MRVRVSYAIDASDDYRRAINLFYGKSGLASREDVKRWLKKYEVIDPGGFAGTLPTATILNRPNKGQRVILPGPRKEN